MEKFRSVEKCNKCGAGRFVESIDPEVEDTDCNNITYKTGGHFSGEYYEHDFLLVTCHRCGYQWAEECKDCGDKS